MSNVRNSKYFPKYVYSTLFPLCFISTLVGLSSLNSKLHNGRKKLVCSKCSIAMTVLFVVLYCSILCYIFGTIEPIYNVLCRIRFYRNVFSVLLYLCEIGVGCVHAKKIVDIFRNIDEVDDMLQGLKISVSYEAVYRRTIIYIFVILLWCCMIILLLGKTEIFPICYSYRWHSILMEGFAYFLPFIANALMELQYLQYLNIIRSRYKKLNKWLLERIDLLPPKIDFEFISTITKVRPKSTKETKASDPLYTLNQVVKIHMILTQTARLVNKAFCFQQLLKIAMSFVSIVGGLFLFAMVFAVKDPSRLQIEMLLIICTLSNALEIFVIVRISAETCRQANDCPIILHRIRNSTTNEKLKSQIDLHSLQMHHSKLAFSVCGLFPLDYSLLFSVVAGATTYLVILIQFNMDMVKAYDNGTLY